MITILRVFLCAAAAITAWTGNALAAGLTGDDTTNAISGKTFWYNSKTQGITYRGTVTFKEDGTVSSKDLAGFSDSGKWWVDGDKLCRQLKKAKTDQADCQTVAQSGVISYRLSGGFRFSHHISSKTKLVQQTLTDLGYDPGPVDGAWGGKTRMALNEFQVSLGFEPTHDLANATIELMHVIALGAKKDLVPADALIGNTQVRDDGTAIHYAEDGKKTVLLANGRQAAAKWWRRDDGTFCEHVPSEKRDICEGDADQPWIGYRLGDYWIYYDKTGERKFQVAIEAGDTLRDQPLTSARGTSNDIIAAIEKQEVANPKQLQDKLRQASLKPPSGAGRRALMKFYLNRGIAATDIGLVDQANSDLTEAVRLAKSLRAQELDMVMLSLAFSNWMADPTGAEFVRNLQNAEKVARNDGWQLGIAASLSGIATAFSYIDIGDAALARAQHLRRKLRGKPWFPKFRSHYDSRILRAKFVRAYKTGRFEDAETYIRKAIANAKNALRIRKRSIEHDQLYGVRLDLGYVLSLQGRHIEAEIETKAALLDHVSRNGRYNWRAVRAMYFLVSIFAAGGKPDEAVRLAELMFETGDQMGMNKTSTAYLLVRLALAQVQLDSGIFGEALKQYALIEEAVKDNPTAMNFWLFDKSDYLLTLALGDAPEKAVEIAQDALVRTARIERQDHLMRAAYAIALARTGQREAAYREFQEVITPLAAYNTGDDENLVGTSKEQRIRMVLEAYMDFLVGLKGTPLEKTLKIDAVSEAFRVADAARGSSVQRALSASSARTTAGDDKLAELVRSQQDVAKRLSATKSLLSRGLSRSKDEQNAGSIKSLRAEIKQLSSEFASLNKRIEKEFPSYAELLNPKPPTIADVQDKLGEGEAYISIYTGRKQTYVWAVPKTGEVAFAVADANQDRLAKMVQSLRDALNPSAASLGGIPDFDLRIAHRLYAKILEPVESVLKTSKSLLITTNGALGELPLSVLPTKKVRRKRDSDVLFAEYRDVPWLVRSHALTLLPSAASLITLRSLPAGDPGREPFIGFGDPFFNADQAKEKPIEVADAGEHVAMRGFRIRGLPLTLRAAPETDGFDKPDLSQLPRLPDTAAEVRGLALSLNADLTKSVILGEQASEAYVKTADLSGYKVVAFATHGLIPGELSGLDEPALALSAPGLTKSKGDGLLTMSEILQLKLDADWVVLSACNTGSSRGDGAEAVSGLGRAFFFAGTRSLLVSSWPVETTSARLLTTDLFERQTKQPDIDRAEALRQAMAALIDRPGLTDKETGKPLFYYAHPIFWAPFILVGDGGS